MKFSKTYNPTHFVAEGHNYVYDILMFITFKVKGQCQTKYPPCQHNNANFSTRELVIVYCLADFVKQDD